MKKKKSFRKGFIIVKFNDQDQITIGRTYYNTIRIKDISVSRNHCTLTKKEGRVFIEDKGSKFGTLLYLSKPAVLSNFSETLSLSSGKTVFYCSLSKSWNLFANLCSTWCCKYKNEEEFVLTVTKEDDGITNKTREIGLNDSYEDYVIYLETIIKNNNSSFII